MCSTYIYLLLFIVNDIFFFKDIDNLVRVNGYNFRQDLLLNGYATSQEGKQTYIPSHPFKGIGFYGTSPSCWLVNVYNHGQRPPLQTHVNTRKPCCTNFVENKHNGCSLTLEQIPQCVSLVGQLECTTTIKYLPSKPMLAHGNHDVLLLSQTSTMDVV